MDKKLLSVLIFCILAVSVGNLLLSVGIVSLLLANNSGTGDQSSGAGSVDMGMPTTNNSASAVQMNELLNNDYLNRTNVTANNTGPSPVLLANNTSGANTSTDSQLPSGPDRIPSGSMPLPPGDGQMPPMGQMPPGGQMPQSAGQAPAGTGQAPIGSMSNSAASQLDSSTGGQLPATTGQAMSGDQLISSLLQQASSGAGGTYATPLPGIDGIPGGSAMQSTATPATTSWVFNGTTPFGGN